MLFKSINNSSINNSSNNSIENLDDLRKEVIRKPEMKSILKIIHCSKINNSTKYPLMMIK